MNTKSCIFTSGFATSEIVPLLVFMSEIKINLTSEKIKFSVSFKLKYGKNQLISVGQPPPQNINFFPSHQASV